MAKKGNVNLDRIYDHVSQNKLNLLNGCLRRNVGEILIHLDDRKRFSEAEKWIMDAIQNDKQNGIMCELGKDYALYAELYKRKGDLTRGQENLVKAIKLFEECGAQFWVEKYEKELAKLS